jgi:hypothetical protein
MADTLPSNGAPANFSPTKTAHNDLTELPAHAPATLAPTTPLEEERDLELVGLPTDFDPDAEPPAPAPPSEQVVNPEDVLQVPIRSIEDEDAEEEAKALAELEKRRNRMNGNDEGDEEEDLTEILRGLAGNQGDGDGDGDMEGEGENENEQVEDEIIAEQSGEDAEIILGEEVPFEDSHPTKEDEPRGIEAQREQVNEDVQMRSSKSRAVSPQCSMTNKTVNSSPLSDLPDLPSTMPISPPPIPVSPPRSKTKRVLSQRPESPAESSTAGAKRARLESAERDSQPSVPLPQVNGSGASEGRKSKADDTLVVTGKRARKQKPTQELDYDDLESHSDSDLVPSKETGKAKTKTKNGKPKG